MLAFWVFWGCVNPKCIASGLKSYYIELPINPYSIEGVNPIIGNAISTGNVLSARVNVQVRY